MDNSYYVNKLSEIKLTTDISKLRLDVHSVQVIRSKIAQFYILITKLNQDSLQLSDIAETWFKQLEGPLTKIASQARKRYKGKKDRTNYFVLHILFYLLTGEISSTILTEEDINKIVETRPCPFLRNSWNFISILKDTDKCLCMCYASYIRAAAEEFHLDEYVSICENERTYSILISDNINIGVGFKNNKYNIAITTDLDLSEAMENIPALTTKIIKSNKLDRCSKYSSWNDIIILLNRILDKRDSSTIITELLYLGIIYELEDFIDNLLLLYLINSEMSIYYNSWNTGKLAWKEYNKMDKKLTSLMKPYKDNIRIKLGKDSYLHDRIVSIAMRLASKK